VNPPGLVVRVEAKESEAAFRVGFVKRGFEADGDWASAARARRTLRVWRGRQPPLQRRWFTASSGRGYFYLI